MLPPGKIPPEKLKKFVFNHLGGARGERVIISSGPGVDAAAIDFGSSVLVASTDPITGAGEGIASTRFTSTPTTSQLLGPGRSGFW